MLRKVFALFFAFVSFLAISHGVLAFTGAHLTADPNAPNRGLDSGASANWSGYVAEQTSYTGVGGNWRIPAPENVATNPLATDATWVGIGGVKTKDLIQAGTQAVVENGIISYQAWYEMLPDYQKIVPLNVNGGDSMAVSLMETSPGIWHLSMTDVTNGKTFSKDLAYDSSHSSADWMEEMPVMDNGTFASYIPLDDFGSVTFTGAYAVDASGMHTVLGTGAKPLTMVSRNGETLAMPALLADNSFSVNRTSVSSQSSQSQNTRVSFGGHRRRVLQETPVSDSAPSSQISSNGTVYTLSPGQSIVIPFGNGGGFQVEFSL